MRARLLLGFTLLVLAACGRADHGASEAGISVAGAWARPSFPPHENAAAFLELTNGNDTADALIGLSVGRAAVAELHTMEVDENDVMRMRPVERMELPPGETLTLKPGADHLMFFELDGQWKIGEEIHMVLHFEHAENLRVVAKVEPMDAHR